MDKRPTNDTERHLGWLSLPAGSLLSNVFLRPHETFRLSADDSKTYVYTVLGPPGSEQYGAVGRPWPGRLLDTEDLDGQSPEGDFFLCLTVPGIGGRSSMDLCQGVHESMLEQGSCLRLHETLRLANPVPSGQTWEGAYADDHLVVQKCTHRELVDSARLRDSECRG